MTKVNICIHGVPVGFEQWGSDEDSSIISSYYNHDDDYNVPIMRIEVFKNKTFYSYLRYKDVYNVEGRSGSYFGMTIAVDGGYYGNVSLLFTLFSEMYKQGCVNQLIKKDGNKEIFLVRSFSEKQDILNKIKSKFENYLSENLSLYYEKFDANIRQNGLMRFNLLDVDSPYFVKNFKEHKIIVSEEASSFEELNADLQKQIKPLNDSLQQEKRQNSDLTSQLNTMESKKNQAENRSAQLQKELELAQSNLKTKEDAIKEQKKKTEALENNLKKTETDLQQSKKKNSELTSANQKLSTENSDLKKKLENVVDSKDLKQIVSTIDNPIKTLARLMAGQFPEKPKNDGSENFETVGQNGAYSKETIWLLRINTLLLVVAVVFAIMCFFRIPNSKTIVDPPENYVGVNTEENVTGGTGATEVNDKTEGFEDKIKAKNDSLSSIYRKANLINIISNNGGMLSQNPSRIIPAVEEPCKYQCDNPNVIFNDNTVHFPDTGTYKIDIVDMNGDVLMSRQLTITSIKK